MDNDCTNEACIGGLDVWHIRLIIFRDIRYYLLYFNGYGTLSNFRDIELLKEK